jgi:hypothetical protein
VADATAIVSGDKLKGRFGQQKGDHFITVDNLFAAVPVAVGLSNASLTGTLTSGNGAKITGNTGAGGIMTAANQRLGFFNVTPIVQPAGTGELVGMAGNGATNANAANMTANGNTGNAAYSLNDVVKALKTIGLLTQ